MDKNPPANVGDTGSNPGPRRSHMPQGNEAHKLKLLTPRAATTEAHMPESPCSTRKPTAVRCQHHN